MIEHLNKIQLFTVAVLPVIFAVTVHEVAHGFAAKLLGDKTASLLGRLTLNPIKHIDLLGTIIVPILLMFFGGMIFGWAKPVPVNPQNFNNPRRDMMVVSCAGPLANVLMALLWAAIAKLALVVSVYNTEWTTPFVYMGIIGIQINILLAVLNLFPLPPLDGGHIAIGLLPQKLASWYSRISPMGFFILLIIIFSGFLGFIINPVINALDYGVRELFHLPLGF